MKTPLIIVLLALAGNAAAQQWKNPPYNAQLVFDVPNPPKISVKSDTVYQHYKNNEQQEFMIQWVLVRDSLPQATVFYLKDGGGDDYNIRGIRRTAIAVSNPFKYVYQPQNPDNKRETVNVAIQLFRKEGQ